MHFIVIYFKMLIYEIKLFQSRRILYIYIIKFLTQFIQVLDCVSFLFFSNIKDKLFNLICINNNRQSYYDHSFLFLFILAVSNH